MAIVTGAALGAAAFGGLINEDVMQQIWDISNVPLPFTDRIGSGSHAAQYAEWTEDELAAPDITNAEIDGADQTGADEILGTRVGNQSQISVKRVKVSTRSQNVDVIGQSDALAYQVMQRQKELRRDVEAIMLTTQASVADNGSTTAGKSAGLGAWLNSNTLNGAAGSPGGFAAGTVAAPTPGTQRGLTETMIRDIAQQVYEEGGNPTCLMSTPGAIRKLSEYMFGSSARIATLTAETGQSRESAVAKGSVNVFVTDFGVTLEMEANRMQQTHDDATGTPVQVVDVFMFDPEYLEVSYLVGYRTEPLAKAGLADTRLMSVDWTLKVLNERAHGLIADINPTTAVVV